MTCHKLKDKLLKSIVSPAVEEDILRGITYVGMMVSRDVRFLGCSICGLLGFQCPHHVKEMPHDADPSVVKQAHEMI
jgi:hypothetical protein